MYNQPRSHLGSEMELYGPRHEGIKLFQLCDQTNHIRLSLIIFYIVFLLHLKTKVEFIKNWPFFPRFDHLNLEKILKIYFCKYLVSLKYPVDT